MKQGSKPRATAARRADSEYVTLKEFQEKFRLSSSMCSRLRDKKKMPREYRLSRKTTLIKRSDMDRWEKETLPNLMKDK